MADGWSCGRIMRYLGTARQGYLSVLIIHKVLCTKSYTVCTYGSVYISLGNPGGSLEEDMPYQGQGQCQSRSRSERNVPRIAVERESPHEPLCSFHRHSTARESCPFPITLRPVIRELSPSPAPHVHLVPPLVIPASGLDSVWAIRTLEWLSGTTKPSV